MAPIRKLLIANRGEIARRIIRTARRLGIATVAVYSEADRSAAHVRDADEAALIGPPSPRDSYLNSEAVLEAARATGADSIHPGYGFLSENADFAEAVQAAGLTWVGAPPSAIRAMGLKDSAKRLMIAAGVPVTPGYLGEDQDPDRLAAEADRIGWPVLIKAVAGGGGRGMREAHDAAGFAEALAGARREALQAFGDERVLLEKLIAQPRHIEVQVFADSHGQVVHLFERDCSLQRRHQKLIEEAPAPGMDAATRAAVTGAAIRAAAAVGYQGAGTVEFIADGSRGLSAEAIWFMEMNTRLQVEHPVTEAVTGLDLVEWQLRIAAGEPLPLAQEQIRLDGWAMEARLYAEVPSKGFLPSVGPITHLRLPTEIRVDSGVEEGDAISPFYDAMIAKLIVHAPNRAEAASRLAGAARAVEIWPLRTNAAFLARCADHPDFAAGRVDTGFIARHMDALASPPTPAVSGTAIGALDEAGAGEGPRVWSPRSGATGFRINAPPRLSATVHLDGARPDEAFAFAETPPPRAGDEDESRVVFCEGEAFRLSRFRLGEGGGAAASDGAVRAPMPGRISRLMASAGQKVTAGEALAVLEAMKMEHTLTAPFDGEVAEVLVEEGRQVVESAVLLRVQAGGEA